jgi:hypothetical protein
MDLYDSEKYVDEAVSVLAPFFRAKLNAVEAARATAE